MMKSSNWSPCEAYDADAPQEIDAGSLGCCAAVDDCDTLEASDRSCAWPPGSRAAFAAFLGISGWEDDASRIIMAARVRLQLIRRAYGLRNGRERAEQIKHARDTLLKTAVAASPASRFSR